MTKRQIHSTVEDLRYLKLSISIYLLIPDSVQFFYKIL